MVIVTVLFETVALMTGNCGTASLGPFGFPPHASIRGASAATEMARTQNWRRVERGASESFGIRGAGVPEPFQPTRDAEIARSRQVSGRCTHGGVVGERRAASHVEDARVASGGHSDAADIR